MSKRYTLPIEVDDHGDYYVTFNDEMLEETGWKEGDLLEYSEDIDGSIILRKVEDSIEGA
jgi:bifunctional DNA-binding transcriptional regulator/antitoxin component of YhaV-PrlF toxin-antitoxin module